MVLDMDSDVAYLDAPGTKICITGFYYFNHVPNGIVIIPYNHPIHVECKYLQHIVAPASKSEAGALFHIYQTAIPI